jgi:putative transposase
MARQNRRALLDHSEVGYCHAVQRTTRRARLYGNDLVTGKSFEHRLAWIHVKLQDLAHAKMSRSSIR